MQSRSKLSWNPERVETVIAAHHEWGLSQVERILDYPGKKFNHETDDER